MQEKEIPFRMEKGLTRLSPLDLGACTENSLLQAVEERLGAGWMGIGYPAEDADPEAADRFNESRIHYNKY